LLINHPNPNQGLNAFNLPLLVTTQVPEQIEFKGLGPFNFIEHVKDMSGEKITCSIGNNPLFFYERDTIKIHETSTSDK
jgi:hypothetical protein